MVSWPQTMPCAPSWVPVGDLLQQNPCSQYLGTGTILKRQLRKLSQQIT